MAVAVVAAAVAFWVEGLQLRRFRYPELTRPPRTDLAAAVVGFVVDPACGREPTAPE